ncbi:MAG: hypothetical protein OXI24_13045 [Candidatus Poribacteria bacterium]|nr:hypothetical protein [Candidatus Poribacteria bacterium]
MAYSNFTLETVREKFQLETVESANIFSDIEPVPPSEALVAELEKKVQLAVAIRTEKARSELIVTNVLVELREQFDRRISLFSGIDLSVDPEQGLTGTCDFLISLSPGQFYLEAPIIVLVEAKNADPTLGIGQCVAEMIAAQRFNQQKRNNISCVYGSTTTGTEWLFLKLEEKKLYIDMAVYPIERCDKILGILSSMVNQTA